MPVLEGLSRGGLPIFNWSIANPDKVTCVYADAAVCDIKCCVLKNLPPQGARTSRPYFFDGPA